MSTSRLRLQKMSAFFTCSVRIRLRSASRLSSVGTIASPCVTRSAGEAGGVTLISFGFIRKASARRRISGGMVAEKNSVCRIFGKQADDALDVGMNPMSSIRSASSITRIFTSLSRILPRSKRSMRRPGVAISTSTPRSSVFS